MAVSPVMPARYRLPFLDLARPVRLPDWLSSGGAPGAQEARCAPVGNRLMSVPVSARASWAVRRPQPGIDSACCSCSSYGASSRSITSVSRAISALTRSMRSSMAASSAGVLRGEELRAFQRFLQLRDLGPGPGQLGQDFGTAFPGDQVIHDVPAGHPVPAGD